VKNLAKLDKENIYYLYTNREPEKDESLKKEIDKLALGNNFKVIYINSPNRFWWNFRSLPNYLKKNPVDIFHTQYIAPFWLPKNIKLILTIHDISFNFYPQYIKKSDLFFLKTLLPRSLRRADKIITVSKNERKNIIDFYKIPSEKVEFAYNGVDFEKFNKKYSPEEIKKIKSRYSLPATRYILYVGTLQPRKNIPALVEILKIYREKYSNEDLKLVIVGNRRARNFDKKIDGVIKKHNLRNEVIFPGWIEDEDLPAVYKLAHCFVFASLYEGFGIPIAEAMAAGLPVVSSNKSCLPEVGKDAAIFVDPANRAQFAEKIHEVIANKNFRADLVQKGTSLARTYSWGKTAKDTLGIYNSL
jgi:glycosyltransferase involved in cell wall biosynthesis